MTGDLVLSAVCGVCHDPNCPTSCRARELAILTYERDHDDPQTMTAMEEVARLLIDEEDRELRAREEHPEWFTKFPVIRPRKQKSRGLTRLFNSFRRVEA